jgi:hypothetical protein
MVKSELKCLDVFQLDFDPIELLNFLQSLSKERKYFKYKPAKKYFNSQCQTNQTSSQTTLLLWVTFICLNYDMNLIEVMKGKKRNT